MIIYATQPGQLGNSLIIYANFLAFKLENRCSFFYPGFYPYKNYFEFTARKNYNRFSYRIVNLLGRVLAKIGSKHVKTLGWHESINLDDEHFLKSASGLLLLLGWNYRGNKNLNKHSETIRQFFTPAPQFQLKLDAFLKTKFSNSEETVIGLHIRRGDYSWHESGKYFYDLAQYKSIITKLSSLFQNHKIHFLIASNEELRNDMFNDLPVKITFAPNHELLDMYALSKCDFIIGPPSTYTMWASFYGNTPLYMLHDINRKFSIEDFKIQNSF